MALSAFDLAAFDEQCGQPDAPALPAINSDLASPNACISRGTPAFKKISYMLLK